MAQVVERAACGLEHVVHVHVRRLGAEQCHGRAACDVLRAGGLAEAHLRAVERAVEARELDVVQRDREVAERGAHRIALEADVEPASGETAVLDRARVPEHRVEAIRVEVREQAVAAGVVQVLEQRVEVATARVERRRDQVAAGDPAAQVPRQPALGPGLLVAPGAQERGAARAAHDPVREADQEHLRRAHLEIALDRRGAALLVHDTHVEVVVALREHQAMAERTVAVHGHRVAVDDQAVTGVRVARERERRRLERDALGWQEQAQLGNGVHRHHRLAVRLAVRDLHPTCNATWEVKPPSPPTATLRPFTSTTADESVRPRTCVHATGRSPAAPSVLASGAPLPLESGRWLASFTSVVACPNGSRTSPRGERMSSRGRRTCPAETRPRLSTSATSSVSPPGCGTDVANRPARSTGTASEPSRTAG